jgi:hypothetical protein
VGVEVQLHTFLISALDGGEWSVSHPGRFTPRVKAAGTHWIGGWVVPRVGLDAVVRRKRIPSSPFRNLNPGRPKRHHEIQWLVLKTSFSVHWNSHSAGISLDVKQPVPNIKFNRPEKVFKAFKQHSEI